MTQHDAFYELSQEADADLVDIYDYTVAEFGQEQAIKYLQSFEVIFENLCKNPQSGRPRDEVRQGLRSKINVTHTIFYRIFEDRIRIVRVLHSSRDIIKFFQSVD